MEAKVLDKGSVITYGHCDDAELRHYITLARVRAGNVGHTVRLDVVDVDGTLFGWDFTPVNYHSSPRGDCTVAAVPVTYPIAVSDEELRREVEALDAAEDDWFWQEALDACSTTEG